jgi:two-component sensor histidine kinase
VEPPSSPGPEGLAAPVAAGRDAARDDAATRLLMGELSHRVKNTLASVMAIVRLTLKTTDDPRAFEAALMGRLGAMADAHSLIFDTGWRETDVSALAGRILAPFDGEPGRIVTRGPLTPLPPKAALALGLVLHELAVNAAKHGALSRPEGTVELAWGPAMRDVGVLRLTWIESGGPVVRPPVRRGFGSTLIERSVAYELAGEVTLAYPPEGVRCVLSLPRRTEDLSAWAALETRG